jgi:N-acyl-D-amino-acid deacylase
VIEGPDGSSPVPLAPFLKQLATLPRTINIGSFIGQGSVRNAVMGRVNRRASAEEIDKMRALVERGMRDGAFGLISGLEYVPGAYAPLEEIVELAKVAGRLGGHYQSHVRGEGGSVVEAVREAIAVGERGQMPAQTTHHKMVGRGSWGKSVDTLRLIAQVRARGVDVTMINIPTRRLMGAPSFPDGRSRAAAKKSSPGSRTGATRQSQGGPRTSYPPPRRGRRPEQDPDLAL